MRPTSSGLSSSSGKQHEEDIHVHDASTIGSSLPVNPPSYHTTIPTQRPSLSRGTTHPAQPPTHTHGRGHSHSHSMGSSSLLPRPSLSRGSSLGKRGGMKIYTSTPLLLLLSLIFAAQVIIISHIRATHQEHLLALAQEAQGQGQGQGHATTTMTPETLTPSSAVEAEPVASATTTTTTGSSMNGNQVDAPLPRLKSPLIVGCLANMRTVSTTAYNLARVLMERVDPNSVSGWEKDVTGTNSKILIRDVVPKAKGKVSLVYKAHIAEHDYHESADFFLVTYRDPYDMVCSIAKMFRPEIFDDPKQGVQRCHKMADNEEKIHAMAQQAPKGALHVDSSLMHTLEGMTSVVAKMVDKWGVSPASALNPRDIAREVMELTAPPGGVFPVAHPRTELHAHHITSIDASQTKHDCAPLRKVLEADRRCRVWHEKYERMFPPGTTELMREDL